MKMHIIIYSLGKFSIEVQKGEGSGCLVNLFLGIIGGLIEWG